jgi:hypothetical protein
LNCAGTSAHCARIAEFPFLRGAADRFAQSWRSAPRAGDQPDPVRRAETTNEESESLLKLPG